MRVTWATKARISRTSPAASAPAFVETLYAKFKADPTSSRRAGARSSRGSKDRRPGPAGRTRPGRSTDTDALTAALDPTQMEPARQAGQGRQAAPARRRARAVAADDIRKAADDSIRAMTLIRTYRVRGHLAANLDPLGLAAARAARGSEDRISRLHRRPRSTRRSISAACWACRWATIRELVDILRANYCGNVGLEYMHIADVEERRFLQDRMEGKDKAIQFTPDGKKAILTKVIEAEQ